VSAPSARGVFNRVERLVGSPLEKVVNLPEASHVMMTAGRTWRRGLRQVEHLRSASVHVWSLPSHRDIRLLSAQVARLQRSVEELEHRLEGKGPTS
jgi:hypothetical protein